MNKKHKKWLEQDSADSDYIRKLILSAREHVHYHSCEYAVDAMYRAEYYEGGTILKISSTREGFDELYALASHYRGGLMEIKVGDNYVIYGHDFD